MRGGIHLPCDTPGCRHLRNPGQEMCFACWQRLPRDQREALRAAQRGGRFHLAAELGRAARLWLAQHPPSGDVARRLGEAPG